MNERTCIDIFTGLACFSIAARANGVRTVAMCECKPDCRNFLAGNWPGVEIHPDAKTFNANKYRGVWLVCGGPPCQPASLAGKRRGAADDRWLWGEAVRIVDEAKPTWFLFENPPGINGVGLDGVLSDLEGKGYEVRTLNIPACAVDSPQRRERLWIVGHAEDGARWLLQRSGRRENFDIGGSAENRTVANGNGKPRDSRKLHTERGSEGRNADERITAVGTVAHAASQPAWPGRSERPEARVENSDSPALGLWSDHVWIECGDGKRRRAKPGVCGLVNGPSVGLLEALGNAIVWPIAARIIAAMIKAEQ